MLLLLLAHVATALQFAPPAALSAHGLPPLPSGARLALDAPGWTRGIGTGGRVWPAAGALCRFLSRAPPPRNGSVVELGCGTGAVGCFAAGLDRCLGARSVVLTEGGSDALRRLAAKNVEANRDAFAPGADVCVEKLAWGDDTTLRPDLVLGSDVTYDRDAHDRLVATLSALLANGGEALLAHQHRRVASFLSGESQLSSFLDAAEQAGLTVVTEHVDEANPLAPVEILRVTPG